jgi:hypothetical protein
LAQRDVTNGGIRLHDLQLDYVRARYTNPEGLALIHGAVRLSAHVIEKDPRQFASQFWVGSYRAGTIRRFSSSSAKSPQVRQSPGYGRFTLQARRCCPRWKATLVLSMAWR